MAANWTGWHSLGGVLESFAAAEPDDSGTLHIFAIGRDNGMWEGTIPPGTPWTGWVPRGGQFLSAPSAAHDSSGLYLVGVGVDNAVWYERLNGSTWTGWFSLGGYLISDPVVVSQANDMYVYAVGGDFSMWQRPF